MTKSYWFMAVIVAFAASLTSCSTFEDNEGSKLTTSPDEQLTEEMFLDKWDLDGEKTNSANGHSSVGAIPDDIGKDMFGEGWRFERGGVLRVDHDLGTKAGKWRIEGKNLLVLQEDVEKNSEEIRLTASFRNGYLWLENGKGRFMVFERKKFFGL